MRRQAQLDIMGEITSVVNLQAIEDKWSELKGILIAEYGDVK